MTESVRKTKRADELEPGDWVAPDELCDDAAEVLFALPFPVEDGTRVQLVARQFGTVGPFTDELGGANTVNLALEEELAEYRERAQRAKQIADLRAFVDFLEQNRWAPMPYESAQADIDLAKVEDYAERVGVAVDSHLDDRTQVFHRFGRLEYRVIAWHFGGRPGDAQPADDPTGLTYSRPADDDTGTASVPAGVEGVAMAGRGTDGGCE